MIVCVLLPRFQLAVAAGDRAELLRRPVALAPEPGSTQAIGEVSLAAEAFGIHPGMSLGEALARCPRLALIPPDPAGVADSWERLLVRLESIGAGVEPERPGLVCFEARGLERLHGGVEGVLAAARRGLRTPARYGVAPSTISGLRARPALADLPEALERLGIKTLGELAALEPAAIADRFGANGLHALELACSGDGDLRPRPASELVRESLELPEAASGIQLERGLELLIDRLLARRERRGRTMRSVVLSAVLVERGGTWREQFSFREALADPARMRLALAPRLALMPAPALELRLAVEHFGPPAADQRPLLQDPAAARAARLREAIRQARAAAGPDAALRVLTVDPDSRFPERRALLAPFE